jgi:pimeloyl-ACP methyl ester carboxylesterase
VPLLVKDEVTIEYAEAGTGRPVVLVHSSAGGNRQWRTLTEALSDRYRVRAPNLYGYGETTPWPPEQPQPLHAQAELVLAVCDDLGERVDLVGHSFGATVALKAAGLLGSRAGSLVLIEPNPAWLLQQADRMPAFLELRDLRDHVKHFGALGDWEAVARRFADYWIGDGAWDAMPEKRRAAFVEALPPNFSEWDTVMDEQSSLDDVAALGCRTLVMSDASARRPLRELAELLAGACPAWTFHSIADGGHMAPVTRPDLVDPVIRAFLDAA